MIIQYDSNSNLLPSAICKENWVQTIELNTYTPYFLKPLNTIPGEKLYKNNQ